MEDSLTVNLEYNSAKEFFEWLSPVSGLCGGEYEPSAYIFRGVKSAAYDLIPAAFRRGNWLKYSGRWFPAPRSKTSWQIMAEVETLWTFFEIADRQGLRLPEDSQSLRAKFKECLEHDYPSKSSSGLSAWPPSELLSVMALAQHYGVPTRLLDWSWSPYVAAYFAASGACSELADKELADQSSYAQGRKIAVWVLSVAFMKIDSIMAKLRPGDRPIQLIDAPAADNENLRAQQGLFLLYRPRQVDPEVDFECEPFDRALVRAARTWGTKRSRPIFYKLTLPWDEADELLRILNAVGINAASIYPGFKGAADAVKEMRFWPSFDDWSGSKRQRVLLACQRKITSEHPAFRDDTE